MKDYQLSVEEYQKILKSIELEDISLRNLTLKTEEEQLGKEHKLSIKPKARHEIDSDTITFYYKFTFTAIAPDREKPAIRIVPEYKITYSMKTKTPIDSEFFEIFPEASLKFIIWPYFRELVQNTISRMNMPPLVLPTIM